MKVNRQNILSNLQTELEVNAGYETDNPELTEHLKELDRLVSLEKIVLCGETADGAMENCSYIWVDPTYSGELSPGQRQAYEILLTLQQGTVYTLTTIGKLAEMMGLDWALACGKRLENLQSLGAITGLK